MSVSFEEETLATYVRNGAAWLDFEVPGWAFRINTATLMMTDPECCILGQLYKDAVSFDSFWSGGYRYAADHVITAYADRVNLGFTAGSTEETLELQEYWVKEIAVRVTNNSEED